MKYNLVVNEPFVTKIPGGAAARFSKGQIIEDQLVVAAILASPHAHHVVKVVAPEVPVAAAPPTKNGGKS